MEIADVTQIITWKVVKKAIAYGGCALAKEVIPIIPREDCSGAVEASLDIVECAIRETPEEKPAFDKIYIETELVCYPEGRLRPPRSFLDEIVEKQ